MATSGVSGSALDRAKQLTRLLGILRQTYLIISILILLIGLMFFFMAVRSGQPLIILAVLLTVSFLLGTAAVGALATQAGSLSIESVLDLLNSGRAYALAENVKRLNRLLTIWQVLTLGLLLLSLALLWQSRDQLSMWNLWSNLLMSLSQFGLNLWGWQMIKRFFAQTVARNTEPTVQLTPTARLAASALTVFWLAQLLLFVWVLANWLLELRQGNSHPGVQLLIPLISLWLLSVLIRLFGHGRLWVTEVAGSLDQPPAS